MENFWQYCLRRFKAELDPAAYDAFIEPVSLQKEDDTLFLVSPNQSTERWLKQNIEPSLRAMMKEYFPEASPSLSYTTTNSKKSAKTPPKSAKICKTSKSEKNTGNTGLRKELIFESFVPGRANEIALIAAKAIAQGDGNVNPLFIFGNTGLGKTHLVQAIGNEYQRNYPDRKLLYTPARSFMADVVQAFRLNRPEQFKARYQELDMLIVDDIQYIGGDKVRTQEEFFFLFNALYEDGKEIIITCDRSPTNIRDLPSRLTSRFNAGLTTHVSPPEFELRAEILRHKAKQRGVSLETDIVHFIAENIKSSVRELEGALKRVIAMAKFKNAPMSLKLCRSALADLIGQANVLIQPDKIKEKVCQFYNVRLSDLSSKKRHRSISQPRHVAIYLCRQLTNMSLPEIGQHFGKRNHTTVLHSCRQIEERVGNDKILSNEVDSLSMSIKDT